MSCDSDDKDNVFSAHLKNTHAYTCIRIHTDNKHTHTYTLSSNSGQIHSSIQPCATLFFSSIAPANMSISSTNKRISFHCIHKQAHFIPFHPQTCTFHPISSANTSISSYFIRKHVQTPVVRPSYKQANEPLSFGGRRRKLFETSFQRMISLRHMYACMWIHYMHNQYITT